MDAVRKFICVFFGISVSVGLSILVMIKGWGIEPQSYWWIIGVGVGGQVLAQTIIQLAGED
jgi:hypothetical protein